ncbi:MAG TPA: tyrosine-type recombinase/integrase [Chloroflexota bacterium]|nr:tyrosine-type recombinase/integrase [Chloroflexota bacterium]
MWRDEGLVFPNACGGVKPPGNVHETFVAYERAAGVPHISTHGLRHTAASLLVELGVHPKVIQEQLGHESIAITMDLYAHLSESMRRSAADALDALLDERGALETERRV